MWDRYDPRSTGDRDWKESCDRSRGSRGGTSDRDRNDERDARDVFTKDLDLPRGRQRELVRERERVYEINGTESRMLATVGAFRVVSANRCERHDRAHEPRQTFYAGFRKPRELTHDTKVYRAYQRAEERLRDHGGRVNGVVLDYELKSDYQRFLHEPNRGKKDCDGRPDREPEEIARWARERDLPYDDGHVRFPDARIEYEDRDGRSEFWRHFGDGESLRRKDQWLEQFNWR
jgi:hypothetical protein